jgi:hypothetical protein
LRAQSGRRTIKISSWRLLTLSAGFRTVKDANAITASRRKLAETVALNSQQGGELLEFQRTWAKGGDEQRKSG